MDKKKVLLIIFLAVVVLLGAVFIFTRKSKQKIILGNCEFEIEEAVSDEARAKGLSDRDKLCDNCGMLFVFDELGDYGFWMKDMRFDLDMVWIAGDKVVDIDKNISKDSGGTFYAKWKVDRVLEINSGKAEACRIKVGDEIN